MELLTEVDLQLDKQTVIHPLAANPDLSTCLKHYDLWSVIHLVVSAGLFHISIRPQKYKRESARKETNEQYGLRLAPSARKGLLCYDFVQLFVHLLTIAGVYFSRNFYKSK